MRSPRKARPTGVRKDDAVLGAIAGGGLAYFVFAPHGFEHPWHWVIGGAGVWLYAARYELWQRARQFARPRRSRPPRGKGGA